MSTEIYYFSGTGNSLHIARELQRRMPETRLIPIVSLLDVEPVKAGAEAVGFVFPQYASMAPRIVEGFIERLDLGLAEYLFAVATRGGTGCMAFGEIDKILKKKGRRLDAFWVITMPSGSAVIIRDPEAQITPEKIARLEAEAQRRLDSLHGIIVGREAHRDEDLGGIAPPPGFMVPFMPLISLLGPVLLPLGKLAESRFDFYTDSRCNGCGLCETMCLARKIEVVDGKPLWPRGAKCFGCFACLNYCPQQSIQIRSSWYLKSYTEQNGRYHHPSITAHDIAEQKTNDPKRPT
jgi:Pyruvate/2-oxoacid:ferredoxin oxidoreductase delta subunit/flavodoxin